MSIIHDALKKVQLNLGNQPPDMSKQPGDPLVPKPWEPAPASAETGQSAAPASQSASKETTNKPKASKRVWVLTAVLLVLAVTVGTIYSSDESMEKIGEWAHDQQWRIKHFFAGQRVKFFFAPKNLPAFPNFTPAVGGPAPLNLQGIMVNNGAPVALINDKIYEAAEEVNGAKIVSIGENSVTVSRGGKTEILKIRR